MQYLQEIGAESYWGMLLEKFAKDGPVLDIGCGNGKLIEKLETLNRERTIIGVDLSVKQLQNASSAAKGHLLTGDAERLPIPDNTFSTVTARAALHHLPNLNRALNEIRRVLQPNGILLFHEPGAANPFAFLRRRFLPSDAHTPDEQPFHLENLRSSLNNHFSNIDISSYYIISHSLPVFNKYSPFPLPKQAIKWMYQAEQYFPFGERVSWIYVGFAKAKT